MGEAWLVGIEKHSLGANDVWSCRLPPLPNDHLRVTLPLKSAGKI